MTADRLPDGYKYKMVYQYEVTTGTAIGDFNNAYTINETGGRMTI